jgi:hypothetical protein
VNQLPPFPDETSPPDPSATEPEADFALNGYLRLLGLQNQALRKLAVGLDPDVIPPSEPTTSPPNHPR